MDQNLSNLERLKQKIGEEINLGTYKVEVGKIRRFTESIDESCPSFENTNEIDYKDLEAPPTFIITLGRNQFEKKALSLLSSLGNKLNGGNDFEWFQPIKLGDVISVVIKIDNINEREGKTGKMALINFKTDYRNQSQELVARETNTTICLIDRGQ
jgi:hypothetical protein